MFFKTSSTGSTSFSLVRLCDFSVTIPRCYKVVSGVKGQKMAQNDKKFCVTHQISGTIYHMIVIYVTRQGIIFNFFVILFFLVVRGVKMQKPVQNKKNSVVLHISGTIHNMIFIYGTHT